MTEPPEPHIEAAPGPDNGKTLVLVGLMGSGKSTVGRRLAQRLGRPFRDADDEIENAAGMPIPDIFETYGENEFRALEQRVIARLIEQPPHVLATGGGAFMNDATRLLIKEKAVSIWLKAELPVLLDRVKKRNNRPLLMNRDPRKVLSELMEIRYPVYAEADYTVETVNGPHGQAVDSILKVLKLEP